MTPAALPAFARRPECPFAFAYGDDWLMCPACAFAVEEVATFLLASRAAAMVTVRSVAAEVEAMGVDEGAWVDNGEDERSFEPGGDGDVVDAFAYFDGSWSYVDPFSLTAENWQTPNIRTAKLAVQRAHLARALRACGARGR